MNKAQRNNAHLSPEGYNNTETSLEICSWTKTRICLSFCASRSNSSLMFMHKVSEDHFIKFDTHLSIIIREILDWLRSHPSVILKYLLTCSVLQLRQSSCSKWILHRSENYLVCAYWQNTFIFELDKEWYIILYVHQMIFIKLILW